jgi:tetratricopeptide (TPR) repeat protein
LSSAKVGALVMTALVGMYLVLLGERSIALISSQQSAGVLIGYLMLFLPLLALWGIFMELRFGIRVEKLGKQLQNQNAWPRFDFKLRASGRPTKASAEAVFDQYRISAQQQPENWKAWFALGLAYDAAGDRARARKAMREAIRLFS